MKVKTKSNRTHKLTFRANFANCNRATHTVSARAGLLQGSEMAKATTVLEENRLHLYDGLKVSHPLPFPGRGLHFSA